MNLSIVRSELSSILASAFDAAGHKDWGITDHLPDSISPPCVLIGWANPWIQPSTFCAWSAALEVMCVAQRIEPGGKLEVLEEMASIIIPALKRTPYTIPDLTSPYPMQVGGVDYLAASVNILYEMEN